MMSYQLTLIHFVKVLNKKKIYYKKSIIIASKVP